MLSHIYLKLNSSKRESKALEKRSLRPLTWVSEGLVVRVISDKYRSGKFYNKKVHIKTIMNDTQFLATEGSTVLDDLREKDLETVLPGTSEFETVQVMVLKTKELGKVLSKDKKKEKVTVQIEESLDIVTVGMDDVCLYK